VSSYLTTFTIANKHVIVKELYVKDYKTILKCLVNDPVDINELFLNLNVILEKITNLSKEEILELNLFEYFYVLIKIRMTSLGASIFAVYNDVDRDINVEINLQKTLDEIQKLLTIKLEYTHVDEFSKIIFKIPTIKKICNSTEYIFVNNTDINNLPLQYIKTLNEYSKKITNEIKKYSFFKSPVEKYSVPFATDIQSYVQLIKILFNDSLLSLYENIYYLSKFCFLSPQYLEECTYGEFKIFVKKTEEILIKKANKLNTNNVNVEMEPIDINTLYGNDESLSSVSRSEFTP
jgi:hypothetical protein